MKWVYIHTTSSGLLSEIPHMQLDTLSKMNIFKVISITLDAHVTQLYSQKHNNMVSYTPSRLVANG